jgi:hypothetical protein
LTNLDLSGPLTLRALEVTKGWEAEPLSIVALKEVQKDRYCDGDTRQ